MKRLLVLFFCPVGRIGRGTYWLTTLVPFLLMFALLLLPLASMPDGPGVTEQEKSRHFLAWTWGNPFFYVALAILSWSCLALKTKRFHDLDRSSASLLLDSVPVYGPIRSFALTALTGGSPGANAYGPPEGHQTPAGPVAPTGPVASASHATPAGSSSRRVFGRRGAD